VISQCQSANFAGSLGLNTLTSAGIKDFCAKTTRSHVALRACSSRAESGRAVQRLKRCGKSASRHLKKFFWLGVADFL